MYFRRGRLSGYVSLRHLVCWFRVRRSDGRLWRVLGFIKEA